jgi:hypothetical protein
VLSTGIGGPGAGLFQFSASGSAVPFTFTSGDNRPTAVGGHHLVYGAWDQHDRIPAEQHGHRHARPCFLRGRTDEFRLRRLRHLHRFCSFSGSRRRSGRSRRIGARWPLRSRTPRLNVSPPELQTLLAVALSRTAVSFAGATPGCFLRGDIVALSGYSNLAAAVPLAPPARICQIACGRLAVDVPLANRVRSGRKQP